MKEYDYQVYLLSAKFIQDYPQTSYPELMHKNGRPYTCLLIETHNDYFICVPFRSNIRHQNAFHFSGTKRSQKNLSGLDYSKIVIVRDSDYIDSSTNAVVDSDEYAEMMRHLPEIAQSVLGYIGTYMDHKKEIKKLHFREYKRRYGFSTLPYFDDILGLSQKD